MSAYFRNLLKGVFAGFVVLAGIVGSIVSIMVVPGPLRLIAFLILFVGPSVWAGWLLMAMLRQKRKANKVIARFNYLRAALERESVKETTKYEIVQATKRDIEWTIQLRNECYAGEALSKDTLIEWFDANPKGFSVIKEKGGSRVGHLDLLPIRPRTRDALIEGKITEGEIRGDSLYSERERDDVTDIYCEGIIIQAPKGTPTGAAEMVKAVAMRSVLFNITAVLERIANPKNLKFVYAIAASDSGRDVLEHLGFEVQSVAEHRKDKHDLFQIEYGVLLDKVEKLISGHVKATSPALSK